MYSLIMEPGAFRVRAETQRTKEKYRTFISMNPETIFLHLICMQKKLYHVTA